MSKKRAWAAACAATLVLPAAAQEWQYTQDAAPGVPGLTGGIPQASIVPSGSRTVQVSESTPGVLRIVERTPIASNGNICIARPRQAWLEASRGLQVLTIEVAVHGCPETRYVFRPDGSGWEEQKAGAEWVKTGASLAGTRQVSTSARVAEATASVTPQPIPSAPAAPVEPSAVPLPVATVTAQASADIPREPTVAIPISAHRRALVIGNDSYRHVNGLQNARADARAMAAVLARSGFQVTTKLDLDERSFKVALREFRGTVEGGDEVVVFYAGHGVQVGGVNYLLPVDIHGDNEEQVRDDAMPLQRILDDLADRRARFTLAVIDACRDNPFKSSGRAIGSRGLAPTTAATGQMIIYSAGSGQQALDRLGPADKDPNGLFTRVFLREMENPVLPVDRLLRNVRSEVGRLARSVGHTQTPALYDQTEGDFFLRPPR